MDVAENVGEQSFDERAIRFRHERFAVDFDCSVGIKQAKILDMRPHDFANVDAFDLIGSG